MNRPLTLALIQRLPKTDLHCHLDGSLRIATILELARAQGVALPAHEPKALYDLLYQGNGCSSLEEYLRAFAITLAVLQEAAAIQRVAYELIEDCARENVRYLEVRFSPMLHTQRGLSYPQILDAVIAGLDKGERAFGVRWGIIVCAIRSESPAASLQMAEIAVAYRERGVVAFDLAGAESGNPAIVHAEAFRLIADQHLGCTVHAGEAYGPESIAMALHGCGAHRIGHGTRLREDPALLDYVNDHRIPLEVCLSSNLQTGAAPDLESHPLPYYRSYGVCLTINTDNRLMTDTTVSQELLLCHKTYGFGLADLSELILAGFESAFLPYRAKQALLADVRRELAQFAIDSPS